MSLNCGVNGKEFYSAWEALARGVAGCLKSFFRGFGHFTPPRTGGNRLSMQGGIVNPRQDNPDKARRDKTRQDKTRQDKNEDVK